MVIDKTFWKNKKVFITGHTGFKGAWLSFWLHSMGSNVYGYSLPPSKGNNLYRSLNLKKKINSNYGDINDIKSLSKKLINFSPDIVFHLAAQPIVLESYLRPLSTFHTNILGTANVIHSIFQLKKIKAFINVTSDKCYYNNENKISFKESDILGGIDPYSCSKSCAELIHRSMVSINPNKTLGSATVRAGNVVGGGDWSNDRIFPDIIRHLYENKKLIVRNPNHSRPWQYILDCLYGYLLLAQKLFREPKKYSGSWNFGPKKHNDILVKDIISKIKKDNNIKLKVISKKSTKKFKESKTLKLNSTKARKKLGWSEMKNIDNLISDTLNWYHHYYKHKNIEAISRSFFEKYYEK